MDVMDAMHTDTDTETQRQTDRQTDTAHTTPPRATGCGGGAAAHGMYVCSACILMYVWIGPDSSMQRI